LDTASEGSQADYQDHRQFDMVKLEWNRSVEPFAQAAGFASFIFETRAEQPQLDVPSVAAPTSGEHGV